MTQILDYHNSYSYPIDYRPPIGRGVIVIASLYRGYTDTGEYTDVARNLQVARDILAEYWKRNAPAIALVLQWEFLGEIEADDKDTHDQAQAWCLEIVRHADGVHFHYPTGMYLSRGMRLEWEEAKRLRIPIRQYEREW